MPPLAGLLDVVDVSIFPVLTDGARRMAPLAGLWKIGSTSVVHDEIASHQLKLVAKGESAKAD